MIDLNDLYNFKVKMSSHLILKCKKCGIVFKEKIEYNDHVRVSGPCHDKKYKARFRITEDDFYDMMFYFVEILRIVTFKYENCYGTNEKFLNKKWYFQILKDFLNASEHSERNLIVREMILKWGETSAKIIESKKEVSEK